MKQKLRKLLCCALMVCMVLTLFSPVQAQAAKKGKKGSISYTAYDTGSGVVLILKNKGKNVLDVNAKVVYYNSRNKMVGTSSENNYAFEGKGQCSMYFNAPRDGNYESVEYDSYKVNINAEKAANTISKASKISVSSDMESDNVTAKVKNKSKEELYNIQLSIVWYNDNGKVIGQDYKYAECLKPKTSDYITFDFPYDSDYETIYPDSYKIFVDNAYTYTWMK